MQFEDFATSSHWKDQVPSKIPIWALSSLVSLSLLKSFICVSKRNTQKLGKIKNISFKREVCFRNTSLPYLTVLFIMSTSYNYCFEHGSPVTLIWTCKWFANRFIHCCASDIYSICSIYTEFSSYVRKFRRDRVQSQKWLTASSFLG